MNSKTMFFAAGLLGSAAAVHAAGFQRADERALASLTQGFGSTQAQVLQRMGGTRDEAVAALRPAVCPGHCTAAQREMDAQRSRLQGNGWHLDVFGDGTLAEFADDRQHERAHAQGVDAAQAMSQQALETAGRAYIARSLASVITLGPGEALVAEATYSRVDGGSDAAGHVDAPKTTANRIVFTRELDGVPVVGNGSKVILTFLNDGSLESFRYDWPRYVATGRTQAPLAASTLLQRVQRVVGARVGAVSAQSIDLASAASGSPLDLGAGIALQRFECGYYDAGLLSRDASAPVQAGCAYHALHTIGGELPTTAGYSGAVPAAQKPMPDARWPEVALLGNATPATTNGDPGSATRD